MKLRHLFESPLTLAAAQQAVIRRDARFYSVTTVGDKNTYHNKATNQFALSMKQEKDSTSENDIDKWVVVSKDNATTNYHTFYDEKELLKYMGSVLWTMHSDPELQKQIFAKAGWVKI